MSITNSIINTKIRKIILSLFNNNIDITFYNEFKEEYIHFNNILIFSRLQINLYPITTFIILTSTFSQLYSNET